MKTRIFWALVIIISSCTKTGVSSGVDDSTAVSADNSIQALSAAGVMLTAHPWMYNAFYMHYIDAGHKGDPLYVRGAVNNQEEIIGTDRFLFKSNHHFVQSEGQYIYKGTWRFSDTVPTVLFMNYDWGINEDSVLTFDPKHLNFTHSFGYHGKDKSYTELIPATH